MSNGYLYVLLNPGMPGLVKVGKTTRDPTNRVSELSSATGVPAAFVLVYYAAVADCHAAELWAHGQLASRGYRPNAAREFFTAPVHEAIDIVIAARSAFESEALSPSTNQARSDARDQPRSVHDLDDAWDLYGLASEYSHGSDEVLINQPHALRLYEQAAAMGLAEAAAAAGSFYQFGIGETRIDLEKALTMHRKAVDLGQWTSIASIAEIFMASQQPRAAGKHWVRFFEAARSEVEATDELAERETLFNRVGSYGRRYVAALRLKDVDATVPRSELAFFQPALNAWWESAIDHEPEEELMYEYINERSFLDRLLKLA